MANILKPGEDPIYDDNLDQDQKADQFLQVDNYLGEFDTEDEKAIARANLNVPDVDYSYDKLTSDTKLNTTVANAIRSHLNSPDPHGILPQVNSRLNGMVKDDGTTPFLQPLTGRDPISDFHLTTKRFVTDLLNNHILKQDPHNTMGLVMETLKEYALRSEVYMKGLTYTKQEVDGKFTGIVKTDGTTPFVKPQLGVDPQSTSHLTTKRYVDNVMWEHITSIDPHGFMTILNQRLANYYTRNEVYTKAETFSRALIHSIINSLVLDAAKQAIDEHISQYDPHGTLEEVKNEHYVKRDGTVPFTAPQKGIDAVEDDHLVTLRQLSSRLDLDARWITSGPVQTTVGFIEDNSLLPKEMNLQQIMDAIFYGKAIEVKAPEFAALGEVVTVCMFIRGSAALIQYAELYLNGKLVGSYVGTDFENGQLCVESFPIDGDTTFTFKVYYPNSTELEAEAHTKVSYQVFIGLLPKWKFGSNVTYEYLQELVNADPINNKFIQIGSNFTELEQEYNFFSPQELKHPFIALPKEYPDLIQLVTPSQQFGLDAFNVITDIPFLIPNYGDRIYKMYIYEEALSQLQLKVTFKFKEA